jgi:hypothetical protein
MKENCRDTVFKRCSTESGSEKCDSADRENVEWWSVTKLFEVWTSPERKQLLTMEGS